MAPHAPRHHTQLFGWLSDTVPMGGKVSTTITICSAITDATTTATTTTANSVNPPPPHCKGGTSEPAARNPLGWHDVGCCVPDGLVPVERKLYSPHR